MFAPVEALACGGAEDDGWPAVHQRSRRRGPWGSDPASRTGGSRSNTPLSDGQGWGRHDWSPVWRRRFETWAPRSSASFSADDLGRPWRHEPRALGVTSAMHSQRCRREPEGSIATRSDRPSSRRPDIQSAGTQSRKSCWSRELARHNLCEGGRGVEIGEVQHWGGRAMNRRGPPR